jgi:hypothetical protein
MGLCRASVASQRNVQSRNAILILPCYRFRAVRGSVRLGPLHPFGGRGFPLPASRKRTRSGERAILATRAHLSNSLGQRMDSRRAFPRFEVRIRGKLMWADGTCSRDCAIYDLSEDGARIDTGVLTNVPDKVDLFEGKTGNIFECRVRWRKYEQIGLQFVDVCNRAKRRALIERHRLAMASPIRQ